MGFKNVFFVLCAVKITSTGSITPILVGKETFCKGLEGKWGYTLLPQMLE